jgi:hypothetical protein
MTVARHVPCDPPQSSPSASAWSVRRGAGRRGRWSGC